MPKISELATGTVTSAGKIAVAQGSTTIQATVADIGAAAGGGGPAVSSFSITTRVGVISHFDSGNTITHNLNTKNISVEAYITDDQGDVFRVHTMGTYKSDGSSSAIEENGIHVTSKTSTAAHVKFKRGTSMVGDTQGTISTDAGVFYLKRNINNTPNEWYMQSTGLTTAYIERIDFKIIAW